MADGSEGIKFYRSFSGESIKAGFPQKTCHVIPEKQ